ncbi:MAG: hypothetical protein Q8J74_04220 [Candidatus Didemnitutus sp.]|nr:hypothetical protein [Candidatus Didemnitutus sp.]
MHFLQPGLFAALFLAGSAVLRGDPEPAARPTENADPDQAVRRLLAHMDAAAQSTTTLSADFTYTVASVKRQQLVVGHARLMKPNFARFTFSYIAEPAFPNLVAVDGEQAFTFTPAGFRPDRTFAPGPFDSALGARQASGLAPGGGKITATKADPVGVDIRLWDAIPLQAFFQTRRALGNLYLRSSDDLWIEGTRELDGVVYTVLNHHFKKGNIAGGEKSEFDQRLYVAPDGRIHMYVLEFSSGGSRGVQIMKLTNIKINEPMTKESFAFTPPPEG